MKRWTPAPVIAAALLSAAVIAPAPASALTVNLCSGPSASLSSCPGGTPYEIVAEEGLFNFLGIDNTTQALWWGDPILASTFASAVGGLLGTNNSGNGPFFAYAINESKTVVSAYVSVFGSPVTAQTFPVAGTSFYYARVAAAPVPGPLPVLGALAAFGFSRKLRQRIQAHRRRPEAPAVD